jgi:hypothetical protein
MEQFMVTLLLILQVEMFQISLTSMKSKSILSMSFNLLSATSLILKRNGLITSGKTKFTLTLQVQLET